MSNQLEVVTSWVMECRDTFASYKPAPEINFDREAGFAVQLLRANDYLTKIAHSNGQSLVDAVNNVAAIGISLNPAKKQAYLVPRKVNGRVQVVLDISYRGMADLAVQGGFVKWVQCKIVRAADTYRPAEIGQLPLHEYDPFAPEQDRGLIRGVYCVVKTAEGDYLTHEMPIADVFDIRARSESYKAYLADNSKKTPWVTDEGEMIRKTCVKQASKLWPRCDALQRAINYLDTSGGEGIELAHQARAEPTEPAVLPEYSEQDFEKNLPAWKKVIANGRRSPEDVIATVASKARLSADQIRRINNLKPIDMEAA